MDSEENENKDKPSPEEERVEVKYESGLFPLKSQLAGETTELREEFLILQILEGLGQDIEQKKGKHH